MTKKKTNELANKVKANREKRKKEASSYKHFVLPEGMEMFNEPKEDGKETWLDFLMYEVTNEHHLDRDDENEVAQPGDQWWVCRYKIHYSLGPTGKMSRVCPETFGKPCPICEAIRGGEVDQEEAKKIRAKHRELYAVVPSGAKNYDEEVHLWDISYHNFRKKFDSDFDIDPDENARFLDLEDGLVVRVRWRKELNQAGKPYGVADRVDFYERDENDPVVEEGERLLKDVPQLDECLDLRSYDELKRLFWGEPEDQQDDEEDEPPFKEKEEETPKRAGRKKKSVKSDEDRPAKKSTREKKVKEEEQEEEEEDKPKSRVKKQAGTHKRIQTKKEEEPKRQPKEEEEYECPAGYKFGKDFNKYEECEECDIWENCGEEYEEKYKKG